MRTALATGGLRFIPNLSMLWLESSPYERFDRARSAGFGHAEILFPQYLDRDELLSAVRSSGIRLLLFDIDPGDMSGGELGLLCLPEREGDFRRTLDEALDLARCLATPFVNVLVGRIPFGAGRSAAEDAARSNLSFAAARAERQGITLLVEAINSKDQPGYLVDTVDAAARLVRSADSPAVRLQLDVYHAAMHGDDPVALLRTHRDLIGHVQIADHPGRHQPGSGRLPFDRIFGQLREMAYGGHVGLEFAPLGGTDDSLSWLPSGARG